MAMAINASGFVKPARVLSGALVAALCLSACAASVNITADAPDPSVPGQAVTVNVTVSGTMTVNGQAQQGTAPTGTVAITGADTNCTLTLVNGSGACDLVFKNAGSFTLTAAYSGDGNYPANKATTAHSVKLRTVLTLSPTRLIAGRQTVVIVSVAANPLDDAYDISGNVAITGAGSGCTAVISRGTRGESRCYLSVGKAGTYNLVATYPGNDKYQGSSTSLTVVVEKETTTLQFFSDRSPARPGQSVHLEVRASGGTTLPAGAVTITGPDNQCALTLSAYSVYSVAACDVLFKTLGSQTLTASYAGDAGHSAASVSLVQAVAKADSTTHFYPISPEPSNPGKPVTVKVYVVPPSSNYPAPGGVVIVSGADADCAITLANGEGSCVVVFSRGGNRVLTANYQGDTTYNPSSAAASHAVNFPTPTATPTSTATPVPTKTPEPPEPPTATPCGPGTGYECPPPP